MHRVTVSVAGLVAVVAATIGVSNIAGAAASRSCGEVTATRDHVSSTYEVQIFRGQVSCKEARAVIKAVNSGKGTVHRPPGTGRESWYTTLPGGWKCFSGAGGEACVRGPKINSYQHRDEIGSPF
ncbi:MAG: hypothetical protein JST59_09430 [Actinobacteria bacterium]|nr:hypothetical protein [Actinomycetota bacterium]